MSGVARDALRKTALRVYGDPTASIEMRRLAAGCLMLLDGRLPK